MLNQTEADRLIAQMGRYPVPGSEEVGRYLSDDIRDKQLYQGVSVDGSKEPLLHRQAFIQYLTKHSLNPPGKSAYTMSEFLGREGLRLYKNALAEEVNSREYRDALFNNSVRHYEGNALRRRVIIPFAGASATGKTHASSAVMDTICHRVGVTAEATGNDVLVVDGAIARSTSQVRDLLVRVATNQGCQQLTDLHKQSGDLDTAKQCIQNVGFASSMHLMILETFTKFGMSGGLGISGSSILKNILQAKGAAVVFCRMKGEGVDDQKNGDHRFQQFKSLISTMGEKRAWWQKTPEPVSLDLSTSVKLPEFKAYVSGGFTYGDSGSKQAERWMKKHVPDALIFHAINDLYAYKQTDDNTWVEADAADKDTFICSKRVYNAWLKNTEGLSLPDYNGRHDQDFKPLIYEEIDVSNTAKVSYARDALMQSLLHTLLQSLQEAKQAPDREKYSFDLLLQQIEDKKDLYPSFQEVAIQEEILLMKKFLNEVKSSYSRQDEMSQITEMIALIQTIDFQDVENIQAAYAKMMKMRNEYSKTLTKETVAVKAPSFLLCCERLIPLLIRAESRALNKLSFDDSSRRNTPDAFEPDVLTTEEDSSGSIDSDSVGERSIDSLSIDSEYSSDTEYPSPEADSPRSIDFSQQNQGPSPITSAPTTATKKTSPKPRGIFGFFWSTSSKGGEDNGPKSEEDNISKDSSKDSPKPNRTKSE